MPASDSTQSSRGSIRCSRAAPFLTGHEFGLADAAYLPWILRAESMLGVDLDAHPAVADWAARAGARPSIAAESALLAAR